jgi:hypothetical protein
LTPLGEGDWASRTVAPPIKTVAARMKFRMLDSRRRGWRGGSIEIRGSTPCNVSGLKLVDDQQFLASALMARSNAEIFLRRSTASVV